jgi:hypothetical protein
MLKHQHIKGKLAWWDVTPQQEAREHKTRGNQKIFNFFKHNACL